MKKINIKGTSADAILLAFIKLVTMVLGMAITRLLSEYLAVHDYGTYSQILLIVSTISSITMFGMMDGVNFFYASEADEKKRESYIATIFALQCTLSTIAGGLILIVGKSIEGYFENPEIKPLLIFAAILPLLQNLAGMSQVLFVAVGKARLLAFRNLAFSLIRLISVLIIVWVAQNVVVVLVTSVVLDIGQMIFFWTILNKNGCYIRIREIRPNLVGHILRYCAPMATYVIFNTLNRDIDKYLISVMTDTETLALYTNASKQLPFDIIMAAFCTVLIPHITGCISRGEKKKATRLYKLFLEITYISTTILCCAALSASPQLMKLLYSNKYTSGLSIFCIYILVDLLRFTNITLILSAAGRTKRLMLLGIGSVAMNVVLNLLLYKSLGLIGPAIATLLVTIITGVLILCFSANVLDTRLSKLFDIKYLTLFVIENVALTVVFSIVRQYLDRQDVHYFVILLIVGVMYVAAMLLLNGKRLYSALKKVNCAGND